MSAGSAVALLLGFWAVVLVVVAVVVRIPGQTD